MKGKGKALKALREEVELLRMDLILLQGQFAKHLRDHQPTPPNIYPTPPYTFPNTWPHIISSPTCVFGSGSVSHAPQQSEVQVQVRVPEEGKILDIHEHLANRKYPA